jgi:hypothetical protein
LPKRAPEKVIIGWREWISLPDLGIEQIKVKVDTGARTSAIHATNIEIFTRRKIDYVSFSIHPLQHKSKPVIQCIAPLVGLREIKSSTGHVTERPVIRSTFLLGDYLWEAEMTLVNRDMMGFRMLLGREAIRPNYLVHPGKSYLLSKQIGK